MQPIASQPSAASVSTSVPAGAGWPWTSRALANPGFRTLLLALACIPVALVFLLQTIGYALAHPAPDNDLRIYMQAAQTLHQGGSPYAGFFASKVPDTTKNGTYIYPPFLAWALQPALAIPVHARFRIWEVVLVAATAGFFAVLVRALPGRSRQLTALLFLLVASSSGLAEGLQQGQVSILILLPTALWFLTWRAGRAWPGGAALGLGVAIKLVEAPCILLLGYRQAWKQLAGLAAVVVAVSVVGDPRHLPEYLGRVLPALSAGSGYFANAAPQGLIERLAYPATLFGQFQPFAGWVRVVGALIALGALGTAWWALRGRRVDSLDEAALALALTPLVLPLAWPIHLTVLLIPQALLLTRAVQQQRSDLLAVVAVVWLLFNPAYVLLDRLLSEIHHPTLGLLALSAAGPVAAVLLFAAVVREIRRSGALA